MLELKKKAVQMAIWLAALGCGGGLHGAGTTEIKFTHFLPEDAVVHFDPIMYSSPVFQFLDVKPGDGTGPLKLDPRYELGVILPVGQGLRFSYDFSGLDKTIIDASCVIRFSVTGAMAGPLKCAYIARRYCTKPSAALRYEARLEYLGDSIAEWDSDRLLPFRDEFAIDRTTGLFNFLNAPVSFCRDFVQAPAGETKAAPGAGAAARGAASPLEISPQESRRQAAPPLAARAAQVEPEAQAGAGPRPAPAPRLPAAAGSSRPGGGADPATPRRQLRPARRAQAAAPAGAPAPRTPAAGRARTRLPRRSVTPLSPIQEGNEPASPGAGGRAPQPVSPA